MPKAELHIHIEGSLEPEMIFALAERNRVKLAYTSVQDLRKAYAFADLQSFLDIYYAGASVLHTAQDFYDLATAYFIRARQDNVRHVELFFDPQTHTQRGVPIGCVIDGLHQACQDAKHSLGLNGQLILCFLRHLSESEALQTLNEAQPFLDKIIGVGLDSSELGHPPEQFARVFAQARQLGLHRVAHAGEEGPPSYIQAAVDTLHAERIDHGVRCLEDLLLTRRLLSSQTPLAVCPLSNVRLQVFPDLAQHNIKQLLDAGLMVTINSDDPAYFGGYINDNFVAVFSAFQLTAQDAWQLAKNSFTASFLEPACKQSYLQEVDDFFKGISIASM